MKAGLLRLVRSLPSLVAAVVLLMLAAVVVVLAAAALAVVDLIWLVAGRPYVPQDSAPDTRAASLVIPNWNGRELLARFLPSWVAAIAEHPGSEVIVVDNGSTDGSADWIRVASPEVRCWRSKNLGFGGGSNAGFRAAKNDVVVLLNSDMRVEPDFLAPLLDGFTDRKVSRSPARFSSATRRSAAKRPG